MYMYICIYVYSFAKSSCLSILPYHAKELDQAGASHVLTPELEQANYNNSTGLLLRNLN